MYQNRWEYRKTNKKGMSRMKRNCASTEAQIRKNEMNAIENLTFKIAANFCNKDFFVTLSYAKQPTNEQAREDIAKFNRKMRAEYRKRNMEYKYILAAEKGSSGNNIHIHLLINKFKDSYALIKKTWNHGAVDIQTLGGSKYGKNNNYPQALAKYIVKESREDFRNCDALYNNRYTCSQNLDEPITEIEIIEDSEFPERPEQIPGYTLLTDSIENTIDEYGYKSMTCTYIKNNTHIKNTERKNKAKQKNARRRCRKRK